MLHRYMDYNKSLIKRKRIRIGDISISYLSKDAEPAEHTFVFVHGFPFNKNMWIPQLEALPPSVRGLAVDVRGHGNSTTGHGFFSVDVFAKDLLVFLRKMGIRRSIVCGISMGGYIALRAYQIRPEAFVGLVLSDTNSLADDNAAKQKRFDSIQSVLKNGKRAFSIGFVNNIFGQKTLAENQSAVDLIKSSIRRNTESSICATLLALAARTDTTDNLENITVPTLVIRGAEDRITPREQSEILVSGIPDATYVEIPDCGHLPNLEDSIRFNMELSAFMERIPQT